MHGPADMLRPAIRLPVDRTQAPRCCASSGLIEAGKRAIEFAYTDVPEFDAPILGHDSQPWFLVEVQTLSWLPRHA